MTRIFTTLITLFAFVNFVPSADAYKSKHSEHGHLIRWKQKVVHIAVSKEIRTKMGEKAFESILQSFRTWEKALKGKIEFRIIETNEKNRPGLNLIYLSKNWKEDPNVIAMTYTKHDPHSGKILDSDIALNMKKYRWGILKPGETVVNNKTKDRKNNRFEHQKPLMDLQNTLTHEIGHLLGLGHSDDPDSAMRPSQEEGDTSKRELAQDDKEALKYIYEEISYGGSKDNFEALYGLGCQTKHQNENSVPLFFLLIPFILFTMSRVRRMRMSWKRH